MSTKFITLTSLDSRGEIDIAVHNITTITEVKDAKGIVTGNICVIDRTGIQVKESRGTIRKLIRQIEKGGY